MSPADDGAGDVDPERVARLIAADAALVAERDAAGGDDPAAGLGWEAACLAVLDRAGPAPPPGREDAPPPESIDRYRVVRELGRGGFGVVYLAHDPEMGREVALKVPLPWLAHSPEVRRRFTREALAVAGLDHPNIVPVHDARTVGPVAFIVSTYCPGPSLAAWLRARAEPVPSRVAARLVAGLARGIDHAHGRGIVHRDLKPANVMLQPGGPVESAGMTPRVTDFGLARVADEAALDATRAGLVIGSAPYMAPEQAAGAGDLGPAVDVYALGVTLYEMLVGRPPFVGRSQAEVLHQVIHGELVAPQLLRREVPRDLQTICLHALRRNAKARYATAAALADDLGRFLAGEPIVARPPSGPERAWRWAARHPVAATLLGSAALLAGLVNLGMGWANARLRDANDQLRREVERADRHAVEVDRHLHAARLNLARQAIEAGQDERAQAILADAAAEAGPHRRDFAWTYLWNQSRRHMAVWGHHDAKIRVLALSPDGATLATADASGRVHLWDVATQSLRARLGDSAGPVDAIAFSPDGSLLIVAEAPVPGRRPVAGLTARDARTGRVAARADLDGTARVIGLDFADGGRAVVVGVADPDDVPGVAAWTLPTPGGRLARRFAIPECHAAVAPDGGSLWTSEVGGRVCRRDIRTGGVVEVRADDLSGPGAVAVSPDGRWLVAATLPARVLAWDLAAGAGAGPRVLVDLAVRPDELTFGPDSRALLVVTGGFEVRLVDVDGSGNRTILAFDESRGGRLHYRFTPDGRHLVSCGNIQPGGVQPVAVLDAATGRPERTFPGRIYFGAAIPDASGRGVFLASDFEVASWRPFDSPAEPIFEFADHRDEVWSLAFAPDGGGVVSGGNDERVRFWDPATGAGSHAVHGHPATVAALAWHPRGRSVASAALEATDNLTLWDPRTKLPIATLVGHTAQVRALAYSPDGAVLASTGTDGTIRLWDGATGVPLGQLAGHDDTARGLAFARDGRHLASVGNDRTLRLWDWAGGRTVAVLPGRHQMSAVAYSPDGATLATADEGGAVQIRDAASGEARRVLQADDREVRALAYSPDGATLAAAGMSRAIRLWDPVTGQLLAELPARATGQVNALAFSPDGMTLGAADHGGRVLLYRAAPPR